MVDYAVPGNRHSRGMTWLLCGEGPILLPDPAVVRAWERDPSDCYATVLLIDSEEVEARRRAVAEALRPWLAPSPPAHLTLHVSGPVAPRPTPARVELTVGGADSFASAAFLHADGRSLSELRRTATAQLGEEVHPAPTWTPHITVGTYHRPASAQTVADRLQDLRRLPPLQLEARLAAVEVVRQSGSMLLREISHASPRASTPRS